MGFLSIKYNVNSTYKTFNSNNFENFKFWTQWFILNFSIMGKKIKNIIYTLFLEF